MDKNIVYVPVSVATPPDKDGFYFTLSDGRTGNNWYKDGKWIDEIMNGGKTIVTHWLKPISIDELAKEKTKVLTETLKIVHESLKTYGSHPIIDRQVFKALLNKQ